MNDAGFVAVTSGVGNGFVVGTVGGTFVGKVVSAALGSEQAIVVDINKKILRAKKCDFLFQTLTPFKLNLHLNRW